ncbi:MAG: hypothetical protein LBJ19_00385 [Holosporaceae bacterium]|jgi:glucose-6-phosphate isomerase|nr:hypothetical protein [Holosporaceae bacterium]
MILQNIVYPLPSTPLRDEVFLNSFKSLDCFASVKEFRDLGYFKAPRFQQWISAENFVILGAGGSVLGGKCIHSMAEGLSDDVRAKTPGFLKNFSRRNLQFSTNLDSSSLEKMFSTIDWNNTHFLCVSKSGETLETICQTLLAIERCQSASKNNIIANKFAIVTEDKFSSLRQIAEQFNFLFLPHPKSIGGRFSVFSIVGMLPAFLCGIDPAALRNGGRAILENASSLRQVLEGAYFMLHNWVQVGGSKNLQHVSFIYADKLYDFGIWLAQMYAESTGKSGVGITPITVMGSADQHNQLQLYLDGYADKCFSFFREVQSNGMAIRNDFIPESFSYLRNKTIVEIFRAQHDATLALLKSHNRHLRTIEIPDCTPTVMGELLMHFMLEVVGVCHLMEINPFGQPAVEQGKILAKQMLDPGK